MQVAVGIDGLGMVALAVEFCNGLLLALLSAQVVYLYALCGLQSNEADVVLLLHRMRNTSHFNLEFAAGALTLLRCAASLFTPFIYREMFLHAGIVSLRLKKFHIHPATRGNNARVVCHKDNVATSKATVEFYLFHNAKVLIIFIIVTICEPKRFIFARNTGNFMWLAITAVILAILGIIGGILPVIPGPPLSWVALLCAHFAASADDKFSTTALIVWFVLAAVITVMDYLLPGYFAKLTGGHRGAQRGALAGLLIGIIFTPIGMVLGCFLGAFLGELLVERQDVARSLSAAVGAFIAFILTTGIKVIYSVVVLWQVIKHLV